MLYLNVTSPKIYSIFLGPTCWKPIGCLSYKCSLPSKVNVKLVVKTIYFVVLSDLTSTLTSKPKRASFVSPQNLAFLSLGK